MTLKNTYARKAVKKGENKMAGVEFAKYGDGALGEMEVHFDDEIRAAEGVVHSNTTINKELTHLNYCIGAESYREIVEKTEKLIRETDAKNPPKRKKKDRKTTFSLEVPCPPELEGTPEEDKFYEMVFEMFRKYIPGITGAVVHKDEKHSYWDSKKQEFCVSRNHMHIFGACLTNDQRINAKDCITRELCQKVNDDVQALCLSEWAISYQTGEGRVGGKKTVEQLKGESEVALQTKLARENLEVVTELREEKVQLTKEVEELTTTKGEKETEVKEIEMEFVRKRRLINKLTDALSNLWIRFSEVCLQVQMTAEHWYQHDITVHAKLLARTAPVIEKGKKAVETMHAQTEALLYENAKPTKQMEREVDEARASLKGATEELEQLEVEYDYERE